jgi:diguanylate cyclase
VRIDDGDVEALIARTLPRRRSVPRKSFETDLVGRLPSDLAFCLHL